MSLSVKNVWTTVVEPNASILPATILLEEAKVQYSDGSDRALDIDQWPILLFLRGLGFERISIRSGDATVIERWSQRIHTYEQHFIQDPENMVFAECVWDEKEVDRDDALIECQLSEKSANKKTSKEIIGAAAIPPLEAPLGISPETVQQFLSEVEKQSAQETLFRIHSILREFQRDAREKDPVVWACLVGDIISTALESKLLDKAVQIAEENRSTLAPIWKDEARSTRLFSAYDPKPQEFALWTKLFDTCDLNALIHILETHLATAAGPQILKLVNLRAQTEPQAMINVCFAGKTSAQRLLHPWLSPHWKPKHYTFIRESLEKCLAEGKDEEILRMWVQALLRSSRQEALVELEKFFKKQKWFWKRSTQDSVVQKVILDVFAENPSYDVLDFLRSIRKQVQGEIADQVEKILYAFKPEKAR